MGKKTIASLISKSAYLLQFKLVVVSKGRLRVDVEYVDRSIRFLIKWNIRLHKQTTSKAHSLLCFVVGKKTITNNSLISKRSKLLQFQLVIVSGGELLRVGDVEYVDRYQDTGLVSLQHVVVGE